MLVHFRGSTPRLSLWADGRLDLTNGMFELRRDSDTRDFFWSIDISIIGKFFKEHGVDISVRVATLVVCDLVFFPSGHKLLIDPVGYGRSIACAKQIYPLEGHAVHKPVLSEETKAIEKGIRRLEKKPPKTRTGEAPVRIRAPRAPDDEPDESDPDVSSSGVESVPDDDDDDSPDQDANPREAKRKVLRPAVVRAPPGTRDVVEQDRVFSELWPEGELTGLSLRCARCNYARNLSYVHVMTRAEAVRRLLKWETLCPGGCYRHKIVGGRLLRDLA